MAVRTQIICGKDYKDFSVDEINEELKDGN